MEISWRFADLIWKDVFHFSEKSRWGDFSLGVVAIEFVSNRNYLQPGRRKEPEAATSSRPSPPSSPAYTPSDLSGAQVRTVEPL